MHKVTARRRWTNPLRTTNSEKLFGCWNDFWWNRGVYIQEATQTCGVQKVNNIWWLQRTTSEVTAGDAKLNFSKYLRPIKVTTSLTEGYHSLTWPNGEHIRGLYRQPEPGKSTTGQPSAIVACVLTSYVNTPYVCQKPVWFLFHLGLCFSYFILFLRFRQRDNIVVWVNK